MPASSPDYRQYRYSDLYYAWKRAAIAGHDGEARKLAAKHRETYGPVARRDPRQMIRRKK